MNSLNLLKKKGNEEWMWFLILGVYYLWGEIQEKEQTSTLYGKQKIEYLQCEIVEVR